MLYKNTAVKIKKSAGRYLSLALIVLIGVGFFAGVDVTGPNITAVADGYFSDHRMMDFKIVGTLGLTDADADALAQLDGVLAAVPSYSLDALSDGAVIRVHALEQTVNTPALLEGAMPAAPTECLADGRRYALGDVVEIPDAAEGKLKTTAFTVVGLADSVLYLGDDYPSTTLGDGKLSGFIFVPRQSFDLEAYTEIYLTTQAGQAEAFSARYKAAAQAVRLAVSALRPERERARQAEIHDEAADAIAQSQADLDAERAKAQAALADGLAELEQGARDLETGRETGLLEFARAKADLDAGARALADGRAEIERGQAELDLTAEQKRAELAQAGQEIDAARREIASALAAAGQSADTLPAAVAALDAAVAGLNAQLEALPPDHPERDALAGQAAALAQNLEQLRRLEGALALLRTQQDQLEAGAAVLEAELAEAQAALDAGLAEIDAQSRALDAGYREFRAELAEFEAKIAESEAEIAAGYAEYDENLADFEAEMARAEGKIADAWAELADMEDARWYVFGRGAAAGYDALDSSVQVVVLVSAVLPFFFILIALLMTSNAMARMIAEERGELGTLASLGYGDGSLILTYVLYVLSATWLGAGVGFWAGCRFIPPLIYENFTARLPPLALHFPFHSLAVMTAAASALMLAVTLSACLRALRQSPAALMRPLAPKAGRRILLERIGPVWNRMSFTWKVTVRNMFRYKKRALMTVIGVSGCTALLVTGFGLRDGMSGVAQRQYGQGIQRYDVLVILKQSVPALGGALSEKLDAEALVQPLLLAHTAYQLEREDETFDCYVIVPQSDALFEQYFALRRPEGGFLSRMLGARGQDIALEPDGDGVVITQRMARVFGVQAGGVLDVRDGDGRRYAMPVAAVAENYVSNYLYMSPSAYARIFGEEAEFNAVAAGLAEGAHDGLAERLTDSGLAAGVVLTTDAMQAVADSTRRLDGVIVLIIVVASLLAAVVLYNLTAINISERTRELATLKVLGFRDGEANAYIYREAALLTVLSIALGLFLGIGLHHYLCEVIEDGVLALTRQISWTSYGLSVVLTLVFSAAMQTLTYAKIGKIDMVESLKSVE